MACHLSKLRLLVTEYHVSHNFFQWVNILCFAEPHGGIAPRIWSHPSVKAWLGETVELVCVAQAWPTPKYRFVPFIHCNIYRRKIIQTPKYQSFTIFPFLFLASLSFFLFSSLFSAWYYDMISIYATDGTKKMKVASYHQLSCQRLICSNTMPSL